MKTLLSAIISFGFIISSYSQITFQNQATALGLNTSVGNAYFGNGVSFYDFDNDGWDDITLATDDDQPVRFYKNVNGNFVQQDFNLDYLNFLSKSVTWVDFDNDGDNDLFVTSNNNSSKLLENMGNMTFQDITDSCGIITINLFSNGASWGDYNNDSYLDLFISNRSLSIPNKLYRNNGNGTFTDVSVISGIDQVPEISFCSAFLDINNDGYQDLYVANEKPDAPNKLYKNIDGVFTDISTISGAGVYMDAMTVTVDDYDRDGFSDIYITNGPTGNYLLRNNGDETFTNVSGQAGTLFNVISWGAVFIDADNNKDLDLYVSSSETGVGGFLSAAFYENTGNDTFVLNNEGFPGDLRQSYSNAIGDVDNDGMMDIVVTNVDNEDVFLWKNYTVNSSNWIKLKLEGTLSNKDGVGTRIEISSNGEKQYRYTHCGEGYLSQNSGVEHFGLADDQVIDYIKLNWLSGLEEIFYNVAVNQTLTLTEGTGSTLNSLDSNFEEIQVYPNPVYSILNIASQKRIQNISIYNTLGQRVHDLSLPHENRVDLSHLESGLYMVKLSFNDRSRVFRVIKE